MAAIDIGRWLAAVSEAEPAGPSLEFDADFGALERAAQGKPEQQVGDTLIASEEPDWKEVRAQAMALLDRSRDLQVAGHLAVAELHLSGFPAYADIVTLIRTLLQERWETLHPQLDPEDDNDPTLRGNALLRLADPARVMRPLRDMRLAASLRAGKISWRDIQLAIGAVEPEPGREKPTEAIIRGAFEETDKRELASLRTALASVMRDIAAMSAVFDERTNPSLDFQGLPRLLREDLPKLLSDMARAIDRYAVAEPAEAAPAETDTVESAMPAGPEATPAPRPAGGASAASLGAVTTRADALRLLDLVCQYYERHEPSSPLPLLIERARRLADKNFIEILRDLAPDGLGQAQMIAGPRDE